MYDEFLLMRFCQKAHKITSEQFNNIMLVLNDHI